MDIAIIGSGVGGSSAIRLVKKGHSVSVFENNTYGGKIGNLKLKNFPLIQVLLF